MPLAEVRDRAEVRWIARHDHHEVRPLHRRPGDPPRRIQPARVRMQKQPRHHLRVERRLAKFARVAAGDLAQIEALSDQENNQPGQVVLSHVILNARRQQRRLVNLPGPKVLAHGRAKNQTRRNLASDLLRQAPSRSFGYSPIAGSRCSSSLRGLTSASAD
jgi:hypothetical protein